MRVHPLIASTAALTLAFGATALVGMTATAVAPGWTATVASPVHSFDLHISGTKPEFESADSVIVTTSAGPVEIISSCVGISDYGMTTDWYCDYAGELPVGDATVDFYGEGLPETFGLAFTVEEIIVPDPDPTPELTLPVVQYTFVPNGVIATGTPTGLATKVAIELYTLSEGWGFEGECPVREFESSPFEGAPVGTNVCNYGDLGPGRWSLHSWQDTGDGTTGQYEFVDDYFVISDAPTVLSAIVNSDHSVTVSGGGEYDFHVNVIDSTEKILCESDVDEGGQWSCTTAVLAAGSHVLQANSEDAGGGDWGLLEGSTWVAGGLSALSNSKSVAIASPAPPAADSPTPGPTPASSAAPEWSFTMSIDPNDVHPGDTFDISGTNLPPGAVLDAELHSTPVDLGSTTVSPEGSFDLHVTVPSDVDPGAHSVVVTLSGAGITTSTKEQAITVSPEEHSSGETAAAGAAGDAAGEHLETGVEHSATSENILTNSLKPIADVLGDPARIPAAFAAGLVLLLLAIVPSHLLNTTIGEQYERLARRVPLLRAQPKWYTAMRGAFARIPVLGGLLLTTITAFLFVFADPNFGLTLASLRLFLALAGALFVVTYLANAITALIMRRGWSVDVSVQLRPLGLFLTVAGVIASRMLDFSPGFLIGLVLGLTIASHVATQHAWKAVLIRTSVVTVFAFASWVLYSSMSAGVHHDPTFWNELVLEFFVAIVTEGTVILLVELLPFHLLEGERLYAKSRILWGSVYVVLLTLFILAVVPWAGNWRELGESFWPWFTAVGIFGAVCIAVYLYFRFLAEPLHHDGHPGDGSEDINADERVAVGDDS